MKTKELSIFELTFYGSKELLIERFSEASTKELVRALKIVDENTAYEIATKLVLRSDIGIDRLLILLNAINFNAVILDDNRLREVTIKRLSTLKKDQTPEVPTSKLLEIIKNKKLKAKIKEIAIKVLGHRDDFSIITVKSLFTKETDNDLKISLGRCLILSKRISFRDALNFYCDQTPEYITPGLSWAIHEKDTREPSEIFNFFNTDYLREIHYQKLSSRYVNKLSMYLHSLSEAELFDILDECKTDFCRILTLKSFTYDEHFSSTQLFAIFTDRTHNQAVREAVVHDYVKRLELPELELMLTNYQSTVIKKAVIWRLIEMPEVSQKFILSIFHGEKDVDVKEALVGWLFERRLVSLYDYVKFYGGLCSRQEPDVINDIESVALIFADESLSSYYNYADAKALVNACSKIGTGILVSIFKNTKIRNNGSNYQILIVAVANELLKRKN